VPCHSEQPHRAVQPRTGGQDTCVVCSIADDGCGVVILEAPSLPQPGWVTEPWDLLAAWLLQCRPQQEAWYGE